jgi:hypothetical protein
MNKNSEMISQDLSSPDNKSKGRILRVKHGYNPNSSSAGSVIVFALPVAIFGVTLGFGAISSLIMSHFVKAGSGEKDPVQADREAQS